MTYIFKITPELMQLAQHAIENHAYQKIPYTGKSWGRPELKPDEPALMLVKDSGCYLMSCDTLDKAPKSARLHDGSEEGRLVVVYANGARPEDGHIEGDDFCQDLPGLPQLILNNPAASILVKLGRKSLSFGLVK